MAKRCATETFYRLVRNRETNNFEVVSVQGCPLESNSVSKLFYVKLTPSLRQEISKCNSKMKYAAFSVDVGLLAHVSETLSGLESWAEDFENSRRIDKAISDLIKSCRHYKEIQEIRELLKMKEWRKGQDVGKQEI